MLLSKHLKQYCSFLLLEHLHVLKFVYLEIDHCDPNPCNHGHCTNTPEESNGYKCTCDAGWQGANCDEGKRNNFVNSVLILFSKIIVIL